MPNDKEKEYFTVEMEIMVPAIVKTRVLAEDANEALELASKKVHVERPQVFMNRLLKKKAKVFKWGTNMLELVKNYI